ncbi:hypothetical protein OOU_Y34scaffold01102g4 [Pyricularia oryzae Y34]|uniref:Uncharacterized protein n=1 Tax=Pyricularia oryzae (strain Y34) TaxID=1143189 RepID=A0AA97NLU2_PYRO3|nr:hypothetical protein OOU_Y34scaffold01102g4 [Pyricularia oryzae Y34]
MAGTAASVKPKLVEQMNWAMCMILACANTQSAENVDQLSLRRTLITNRDMRTISRI